MDFSSVLVDVLHLLDENKCDTVWEAFIDFKHRSVFLSRIESEIIQAMIRGMPDRACAAARASGLLEVASDGKLMPNRERRELEQKLLKFQLDVPWA